jgi:hypothetical protein
MMGRHTGDQRQLFYLFNLEDRIPTGHLLRRINPIVTEVLADLRYRSLPASPDQRLFRQHRSDPEELSLSKCRPLYPQERTLLPTVGWSEKGQGTKSPRSSPLRGGKSREAVAS